MGFCLSWWQPKKYNLIATVYAGPGITTAPDSIRVQDSTAAPSVSTANVPCSLKLNVHINEAGIVGRTPEMSRRTADMIEMPASVPLRDGQLIQLVGGCGLPAALLNSWWETEDSPMIAPAAGPYKLNYSRMFVHRTSAPAGL